MAHHDRAHFSALTCPTNVTWTNDIQQMFTSVDVAHMIAAKNIHLDDYNSVKIWAVAIYSAVQSGAMPPPNTIGPDGKPEPQWSADKVNTFGCWIQQGCPQ
jgi:hypothetical protein